METLANIRDAILARPYLCMVLGFASMVAYGLCKLLAIVQAMGA